LDCKRALQHFSSVANVLSLAQVRIAVVNNLQTHMHSVVKIYTLTFTELHRS
jgi:hypothetical protein